MEVIGKLIYKGETQTIGDGFTKREFVIEFAENPQYPEKVKFELIKDKTSLVDSVQIGSELKVQFNLKGREWTNKDGVKQYFNSLLAWKIEKITQDVEESAPF